MIRTAWAALLVAFLAAAAWADGGIFPGGKGPGAIVKPVRTPDQRALLRWDEVAGTETLVIETTLQGEGTDFAWILPLPAAPKIEASTKGLFPSLEVHCAAELETDTAPWWAFVLGFGALWAAARRWPEQRPTLKILAFLGVVGAASLLLSGMSCGMNYSGQLSAGGPPGESATVRVLSRETVGAYDTAVLAATDAGDLRRWLDGNGFHAPPSVDPVIAGYVRDGWVFVASKVRMEAASGDVRRIHPLSFTFPAKEAVYPMRLTGALNESLALDLYVFAQSRARAEGLDLAFCEEVHGWGFHPEVSRLKGEARGMTRLTGTLAGDAMHRDLRFEWDALEETRPRYFTAGAASTRAANAAALLMGVALVVFAGRARRRAARGEPALGKRPARTAGLVGAACVAVFVAVQVASPVLPDTGRVLDPGGAGSGFLDPWGDPEDVARVVAFRGTSLEGEERRMADAIASRPIFTDVAAARAWLAPHVAALVNPFTGEPVREEDSPGNYELKFADGAVRLRVYSQHGEGDWIDLGSFRRAAPSIPHVAVEGRVRDARGEGVGKAVVRIALASAGPGRPPEESPLGGGVETETGPDGRFSVRVPAGFLCDVAVDAPRATVLLVEDVDLRSDPAAPLELVVADGLVARGRVVDANGNPLRDASVRYKRSGRLRSPWGGEGNEVADDGTFEIAGLAPGTEGLDVVVHRPHGRGQKCPQVTFRLVPGAAATDLVVVPRP